MQLVLQKAVDEDLLEKNPVAKIKKPRVPEPRPRYLTEEEWRLLEAEAPPTLRPILTFALHTGMRRQEVVRLQWADVDFDGGFIWVPEGKTGEGHYVPMNDTVRRLLLAQRDRIREIQRATDPARIIPWVFVDAEGNDYTEEKARARISGAIAAAARRAKISDRRPFHTMRHTCASWLVQGEVPIYSVQHILGHKDPGTTKRYAHLAPKHLEQAMRVLDRATATDVAEEQR